METDADPEASRQVRAKRSAEDAVEAEKTRRSQILESTQDKGLRMFMEWFFERTDQAEECRLRTDSKVDVLTETVHGQTKELAEVKSRQDSVEARLAKLETQGSTGVASTAASSVGNGASSFTPRYLECYGWVVDWSTAISRNKTMISDEDASHLLSNILELLKSHDEPLHARVDVQASQRLVKVKPMCASVRVRFLKGTEADMMHDAQTYLSGIFGDSQKRDRLFDGMTAPLQNLRFRVEAAPWKVPHNQAVGRFFGEFGKRVNGISLRGVTGSGKTPSTIWSDPVEGRRIPLAEFCPLEYEGSGQWKVIRDTWQPFASRHHLQYTAEQVEEMVARRE